VTNGDRAHKLLGYAHEVLREAHEMQNRAVWNGTVRRAQEVLELCLKAILVEVGIDYPKQHDVAPLVEVTLRSRWPEFDAAAFVELRDASRELAAKRAPALYAEIDCSQVEADGALLMAEKAMALATRVIQRA
jgi:HEPN domain-containing protein